MTSQQFKWLLTEAVEDADERGLAGTHPAVLATTAETDVDNLKHVTTTPSGKTVGVVSVYMARLLVEGPRQIKRSAA